MPSLFVSLVEANEEGAPHSKKTERMSNMTKKRIPGFLCGCLTTLTVLALGTTASAASGQVTFNFANVSLDGEPKFSAGSTITAANGQQVPSTILYTDAAGGKTNYLPIRAVSELLGVEIGYDSATKTILLGGQPAFQSPTGMKRWQREEDGKRVAYTCGEENHTYQTPPAWRPAWSEFGWNLAKISHDTRNYTANWNYENGSSKITFACAYPSTAGFGRTMTSEDAVKSRKTLTIQGAQADYYQDGTHSILAWENADGLLFYLSGTNVTETQLVQLAESTSLCAEKVGTYNLKWLPQGYSLMDHYAMLDTAQEYWVKNGIALSWTYSTSPLGLPDGSGTEVEVNGANATFWTAEEPYTEEELDEAGESGGGDTYATIPGVKHVNTLAWTKDGVHFRLQSILDQASMLQIAESVK